MEDFPEKVVLNFHLEFEESFCSSFIRNKNLLGFLNDLRFNFIEEDLIFHQILQLFTYLVPGTTLHFLIFFERSTRYQM
jgi:hypothetical protein